MAGVVFTRAGGIGHLGCCRSGHRRCVGGRRRLHLFFALRRLLLLGGRRRNGGRFFRLRFRSCGDGLRLLRRRRLPFRFFRLRRRCRFLHGRRLGRCCRLLHRRSLWLRRGWNISFRRLRRFGLRFLQAPVLSDFLPGGCDSSGAGCWAITAPASASEQTISKLVNFFMLILCWS